MLTAGFYSVELAAFREFSLFNSSSPLVAADRTLLRFGLRDSIEKRSMLRI
jgi:hypothetical protein